MTSIHLQIGPASANLDAQNPRLLIGRDEYSANLIVPDPTVSRRHADIFLQNGRVFVRDMGSSNGTWVNGSPVGSTEVEVMPGQQVFLGHVPLLVEWRGGAKPGATVMGAVPAELLALIQARKQQAQVRVVTPAAPSSSEPTTNMTYRRQGSNDNGVLLIALTNDDFQNDAEINGFLEFTALDDETIEEITVELVEVHRKGAKKGHVWDRQIVKKGPWECRRNDRVPNPFRLRVPGATSITSKDVHWEVRGSVDIKWAYDVELEVPITMHNVDVEKIRDAMGALDLRVREFESEPLGQHFTAVFEPPAQWRSAWKIDEVNLDIHYLGTNLEVKLEVDKLGAMSKDRTTKFVFELHKLRQASLQELSTQFQQMIQTMLQLK
jgi:pSer/pThr/pTyr-binding forkhead associated (FHA) protein